MKGLRVFGDYVAEFFIITILLALSALFVLPFVPMIVGVTGFFQRDINGRRFKDIFTTIGKNYKILIFYTLFQIIAIVLPVMNIYYFNTNPEKTNYFFLSVNCVMLLIGLIYLVTAPTIIVKMNVNFFQLLYNGLMLIFGGLIRSLLAVSLLAGVVAMIIYYPYPIPLTLYAIPYLTSILMKENFYILKAKILNTSVYELKKQENSDEIEMDDTEKK